MIELIVITVSDIAPSRRTGHESYVGPNVFTLPIFNLKRSERSGRSQAFEAQCQATLLLTVLPRPIMRTGLCFDSSAQATKPLRYPDMDYVSAPQIRRQTDGWAEESSGWKMPPTRASPLSSAPLPAPPAGRRAPKTTDPIWRAWFPGQVSRRTRQYQLNVDGEGSCCRRRPHALPQC